LLRVVAVVVAVLAVAVAQVVYLDLLHNQYPFLLKLYLLVQEELLVAEYILLQLQELMELTHHLVH
jgi:hypothetical protein